MTGAIPRTSSWLIFDLSGEVNHAVTHRSASLLMGDIDDGTESDVVITWLRTYIPRDHSTLPRPAQTTYCDMKYRGTVWSSLSYYLGGKWCSVLSVCAYPPSVYLYRLLFTISFLFSRSCYLARARNAMVCMRRLLENRRMRVIRIHKDIYKSDGYSSFLTTEQVRSR